MIPAGTYPGVGETRTVSVGAQWVVGAEVDEDLVYGITKALWHENARKLLDTATPKAKAITLATALDGIAIPLHPGAERYYREAGLLPSEPAREAHGRRPPTARTRLTRPDTSGQD